MSIETRHLRAFIAVAEVLHFGRAAQSLDLAQSALSAHIKRLEDVVGGPLFHRGRRSAVMLTRAGHTFYPEALATMAHIERSERIGQLASRGEAGEFRIGYVFSGAMSGLLSSVISIIRERFPEIEVKISPMETPEQIAALKALRIDVGLVRPRAHYPADVESQVVHREPLLIALAESHPLARLPELAVADLADECFLIPQMAETGGFAAAVDELLGREKRRPQSIRGISDFVSAASLAASGEGVILGPRSLAHLRMPGLTFRPVATLPITVDLALIWRETTSPIVATLRRAFQEVSLAQPGCGQVATGSDRRQSRKIARSTARSGMTK